MIYEWQCSGCNTHKTTLAPRWRPGTSLAKMLEDVLPWGWVPVRAGVVYCALCAEDKGLRD